MLFSIFGLMKKTFLVFFTLLLMGHSLWAQYPRLTESSQISLLTISAGEELYSTFGHSAIRIKDDSLGIDQNYNYGSFDFSTEGFYLKFLRGTLPYEISSYPFNIEANYWIKKQGRGVKEQVLNLNLEQKQKTLEFVENNLKPENKQYSYKFFYDNCSTRLRDIFEEVCKDSLQFSTAIHPDSTFREWIDVYAIANKKLWSDFAMDLAIGVPADDTTNYYRAMFLPDNLFDAFGAATIQLNGEKVPFVASTSVIGPPTREVSEAMISPFVLFFGLLLFTAFITWKWKGVLNVFDKTFFSLTGIAGIVLLLLWFGTNHGVTEMNYNVLWCFALTLPAVWMRNKFTKYVFFLQLIFAIFLVMSFGTLPQGINPAALPILAVIIIRSFKIWRAKLT